MPPATKPRPLPELPPEKSWQRYSANHELPLAGMSSFFVHAILIGVIALAWLLYSMHRDDGADTPPSQDVVMISGGGDGFGGMGAEPGLPGEAAPKLTETTPDPMPVPIDLSTNDTVNLKDAPKVELTIPEMALPEIKTDVDSVLANLEKEANKQPKKAAPKKAARIAMSGTGNPNGQGGRGGAGGGLGMGNQGMGPGTGGFGGRLATKAQIFAMRWHFDLGRNAREHVDQLGAIGVIVVFHAPNGIDYFVDDLKRRPVVLHPGNIRKFKDAVQWHNVSTGSIVALARELRLQFVPTEVYLYVPKHREEIIAAEEERFTKATRNTSKNIKQTKFIFRLRNGKYEPEATEQIGFDGRIYRP